LHRVDELGGRGDGVERRQEARRRARQTGADGEQPELVDRDEVGDHVAHLPLVAPRRRRPLVVVERAQELGEPPPLADQRDARVTRRRRQPDERRTVVAGGDAHSGTVLTR
jgi:hypothetical protein